MPLSGNNFQYSTESLLQSFKNMNKGSQNCMKFGGLLQKTFFLGHVGET